MSLRQLLLEAARSLDEGRHLARNFRALHVPGRGDPEARTAAAREMRSERAFALVLQCQRCLESFTAYRSDPRSQRVCRRLQHCLRTAQRLNRESPIPHAPGALAFPVSEFKSFLRDNHEQMYFLALHSFPSAFDFFCATYVQTPRGYRQELHFHQRSEELTLVLDGQADCVWLTPGRNGWDEAGRRTARSGQAFRIPPRVVHTIENPTSGNRNLTIKLTMFIDDRIGAREPAFDRRVTVVAPVTVDPGRPRKTSYGSQRRFSHGFRGLTFEYCVDVIEPARSLALPLRDRFAFLFAGGVVVTPGHGLIQCSSVLHFPRGVTVTNPGPNAAMLFSVDGLDSMDFLKNPHRYPQYPRWCVRPVLPHRCR